MKKVVCEHCGSKAVEYTFSFNKGLATFLVRLYEEGKPARTDTLGLTYSQRTNSQKLRYWGLAAPVVNEEAKKKAGWWEITDRGKAFVEGKMRIRRKVVMCRNQFVRYEGSLIGIDEVFDGYLYRQDYKDQAAQQILRQADLF